MLRQSVTKNLTYFDTEFISVQDKAIEKKTAILFFDHSKKQAATLKLLAPRIRTNTINTVIGKLRKQALSIAHQSELPVFEFKAKGEAAFGEELFEAYRVLFSQGFKSVIAIGNDCPTLTVADIVGVTKRVSKNQLALGPALDGGTYLIGLHKDTFSKAQFLALDWQKASLLDSINCFVANNGKSAFYLSAKGDLDTPGEFKIAFNSHLSFLNSVRSIIASFQKFSRQVSRLVAEQEVNYSFLLRGPPILIK